LCSRHEPMQSPRQDQDQDQAIKNGGGLIAAQLKTIAGVHSSQSATCRRFVEAVLCGRAAECWRKLKYYRRLAMRYEKKAIDFMEGGLHWQVFCCGSGSWPKAWRVLLKAEVMALGENPRFVVTSLGGLDADCLYEDLYCARGQRRKISSSISRPIWRPIALHARPFWPIACACCSMPPPTYCTSN
jgi:hypothetical protein